MLVRLFYMLDWFRLLLVRFYDVGSLFLHVGSVFLNVGSLLVTVGSLLCC